MLQRIALVYFAASLIVLHPRVRGQVVIVRDACCWGIGVCWRGCRTRTTTATQLSPEGNIVRIVDRALLGEHMYTQADEKTEPEGLLSTLPAIVNTLLGYWTGLLHPAPRRQLGDRRATARRGARRRRDRVGAGNPSFPSAKNCGPAASSC